MSHTENRLTQKYHTYSDATILFNFWLFGFSFHFASLCKHAVGVFAGNTCGYNMLTVSGAPHELNDTEVRHTCHCHFATIPQPPYQ